MANKKCQKLVVLAIVGVILVNAALVLKSTGEESVAATLFVVFIIIFLRLVRLIKEWLDYYEVKELWMQQGEKDIGHQAVYLKKTGKVSLWCNYAPKDELERFCNEFQAMSEQDFGYAEAKSIVEQINQP